MLAAFSLTLPHTPPKPVASGANKFAWLEAMRLLSAPFMLVLLAGHVHRRDRPQLYFNWTGTFLAAPVAAGGVGIAGNWIMPVMSIGQIAEIVTMAFLGLMLKRLGWRTTMILGILGHAARFAVFAFFPENQALIILINVVHGIAYAFFFATVYIFVDEFFPKDVRASAQGLFNLMILGFGPLVANVVGPKLMGETFRTATGVDFRSLFLVPFGAAVAAAIILAIFFHPPRRVPGAGRSTALTDQEPWCCALRRAVRGRSGSSRPLAAGRPLHRHEATRLSMACVYAIEVYGPDAATLPRITRRSVRRGRPHRPADEPLQGRQPAVAHQSRGGAASGGGRTELYDFIAEAMRYNRESGGAFDITVGPLMKAWGFFRGEGRMPSERRTRRRPAPRRRLRTW